LPEHKVKNKAESFLVEKFKKLLTEHVEMCRYFISVKNSVNNIWVCPKEHSPQQLIGER